MRLRTSRRNRKCGSLKSILITGMFAGIKKNKKMLAIWYLPKGTLALVGVISHGDK